MRKPPLYDEVHALPVIDVHTHFETLTETFGYTMPQYFYYGCYFNCYRDLFDPSDIACVEDGGRDVREQFCALLRLWEKIRDTRTGRLFSGMMQTLGCRMEPDAFEPLLQWYAGRTAASIRAAMPTVRGFVCNSAGHPLFAAASGAGDRERPRDGKAIGTKPIREITRAELAHMMIGREETLEYLGRLNISDEVVLEARDIGQAVS